MFGGQAPLGLVPKMSWQEAQELIARLEESRRHIAAFIRDLRKFNPELPEHRCAAVSGGLSPIATNFAIC